MPLPTCPEGYIHCPYEVAHVILESRIQFHLVKCKKVHAASRLVECPFNSTHKVPEIELNCHKLYLCPDKGNIDKMLFSTEESVPLFPVIQNYNVESSESWDDVQGSTYDPMEKCRQTAVLVSLQGATPSERKTHRQGERQRYRELVGPSPQNIQYNTNKLDNPEKAPTRLPQTTPKAHLNTQSEKAEGFPKGRGRGRILK